MELTEEETTHRPVSLDVRRATKFFRRLADEAFLAIVVDDEGELQIFTKGIEPEHIDRIREVLKEIMEGSD